MKFSVILPSLLSDYPGAATGRDKKLIRSIQSVLNQSFTDFELLVIADGCALTEYLVKKNFKDEKIRFFKVQHIRLWGNAPRNKGIEEAKGEYLIYIDSDDQWGMDHLDIVNRQLSGEDWVYFNDRAWFGDKWVERECDPTQYGHCGTSTICHASRLGLKWGAPGYGHDFLFIQQLLKFKGKKISTPEYYVCHIGGFSDI